ncbi:MAG: GTPase Era [Pseudomonadota bacterium]
MTTSRSGFVALIGRPNAGKSTLLNACIGQKIAGVSRKPQTTRNRILGIDMVGTSQVIYLDTPGIHKSSKSLLNRAMNKAAWATLADADVICYLIDASRKWVDEDSEFLKSVAERIEVPLLVLATKADNAKKVEIEENLDVIVQKIEDLKAHHSDIKFLRDEVLLMSSKRPEDIANFKELVAAAIPEGEYLFDPENITDRPDKFVVGELIREQLFRSLGDEIPYGTGVTVDKISSEKTKSNIEITNVLATIIVSTESHKRIVIGKAGSMLKQVGSAARESLERHYEKKVFLELFVRVQTDWINSEKWISELQSISEDGYL